jgi:membrane protein implicated in regulation of membrane protease activity
MDVQSLLWLALGLVAGVVEIVTLSLVFLMVAGGAVAAAAVEALTGSPELAVGTFAVTTGLLLAAVRPPLLRYYRRTGPPALTGAAGLVGRTAEVTAPVDADSGLVKLAGEIWSARPESDLAPDVLPLELGSRVLVVRIDGATAVVSPLIPHAALPDGASSDEPEPSA